MKIRFFDLETKEDAKFGIDATAFFINEYGDVVEFIDQAYAHFYCHHIRPDVGFEIINIKENNDEN